VNNQTVQSQNPATQPQTPPQQPPSPPPQPAIKKSILVPVLLVITILALAAAGVFAYQNFSLKQQTTQPTPASLPTPLPTPPPTQTTAIPSPTTDPFANWKTYVTKDSKHSFRYPPDWIIEDKSKEVDLYQDGNLQLQHDILISKDDYSIKSYNPLAWGPGVCIFSDHEDFDKSFPNDEMQNASKCPGDFVEFDGTEFTYRRYQYPDQQGIDTEIIWSIYSKSSQSDQFVSASAFGITSFVSPTNYDPLILTTMDQILSTFQASPVLGVTTNTTDQTVSSYQY